MTSNNSRSDNDMAVRIALAWRELRRGASAASLRQYLLGANEGAIELGQMDTLDLVATGRAWRMSELAEALRVEPSTATRAVERLVKAGLAERRPGAHDGRVVEVVITPAGKTIHHDVSSRRLDLIRYIMADFRHDELVSFITMLERYVHLVDAFVDAQTTPDTTPDTALTSTPNRNR